MAVIGQAGAPLVPAADSRRTDASWGALGVASGLALVVWMRGFTIDDALISVRYARHLADGAGYRFNLDGPCTDGVTPLPWAFILAPFAHVPPLAVLARAKCIGVLAWIVAAGAWGVAVGRASARREAKLAAFGLLALCLPVGAHAVSGMETGLPMALATGAAIVAGPWACCVLGGMAAAFRPEMVVWSVALAMGVGARRWVIPRVLVATAPFAACAVVRVVAFGRAAPLAVLAKPGDVSQGVIYVVAAALVSLSPLVVFAPLALARAGGRAATITLAGVAHLLVIAAVGGDWMPYARLVAPIVPSLFYAFVLASPKMSPLAATLRVVAAAAMAVYVLVRAAPAGRHVEAHVAALVRAARPELATAQRIAVLDVGWPTAASEASIVDLAGLTDPEIAALPGGHTSKHVDTALLLARDPDVILLYWRRVDGERVYRSAIEASLASSDLIARHYEARATLPSYGEDDAGYTVLRKR